MTQDDKLIWGAEAISQLIGRDERATHHMLAHGYLPAWKVGGRWVGRESELRNPDCWPCVTKNGEAA